MADMSLRTLTDLLGKGKTRVGNIAGRAAIRTGGALLMALFLTLDKTWATGPRQFVGAFILSVVAAMMLRAHLNTVDTDDFERYRHEGVAWMTSLLAVGGVQVANLTIGVSSDSPVRFLFLAPVIAHAMLVAALVTPGVGIVTLSMTALLLGITGVMPANVLITAWLSGAVAAHVVNPLKQRSDLLRALSLVMGAQVVIAGALSIMNGDRIPVVMEAMVWSVLSAIIATSIFWLGVALLEKMFGIVSDWTLLELCSPEQPILKDLVLRAPGTWAHSVGVANLAETAAHKVGANALLCRTMAYYHDIGKTLRPNFFIENQVGHNLHDELTPILSAQVVASHVKDGVEIARKHKIPQSIIDGIEQHHGTSLITFFYHRALEDPEADENSPLSEERFRYPGPRPQSKEAAILHLADMVEAASRVLPSGMDMCAFIDGLVRKTKADGQLDDADLTYKETQLIVESFCKSLTALRHERVVYPNAPKEVDREGQVPDHSSERTLS